LITAIIYLHSDSAGSDAPRVNNVGIGWVAQGDDDFSEVSGVNAASSTKELWESIFSFGNEPYLIKSAKII
jgi:hypothetical protein